MTDLENDSLNVGAPDYKKTEDDMKRKIRDEVEKDLGHLSPAARESIIQSRLGILNGTDSSKIIQVDLGKDAGKKVKDFLFE